MLICVVVLFLLCWGPRFIMEVVMKMQLDLFTPSVYWTRVTLFLLPFIHALFNPIVYFIMSQSFRQSAVKKLTQCTQPFRGRESTTVNDIGLVPGLGGDATANPKGKTLVVNREPATMTVTCNLNTTLIQAESDKVKIENGLLLDDIVVANDYYQEEEVQVTINNHQHREASV